MEPLNGQKPEIRYPCRWPYKVIGRDEARMRLAVEAAVAGLDHRVELSNVSRNGRYRSLLVRVTVASEEQRLTIGRALHEHEDVHIVF